MAAVISMVFTKMLLKNALAIRPCNYGAASQQLLPKVARCIPVLSSRCIGKCAARVLKQSAVTCLPTPMRYRVKGKLHRVTLGLSDGRTVMSATVNGDFYNHLKPWNRVSMSKYI